MLSVRCSQVALWPFAFCCLLICLQRLAWVLPYMGGGGNLLTASAWSGSLGEDRPSEMLVVLAVPGTEALCRFCCCLHSNVEGVQNSIGTIMCKRSERSQHEGSINEKFLTANFLYTINNQHELHVESSQIYAEHDTCFIFVFWPFGTSYHSFSLHAEKLGFCWHTWSVWNSPWISQTFFTVSHGLCLLLIKKPNIPLFQFSSPFSSTSRF